MTAEFLQEQGRKGHRLYEARFWSRTMGSYRGPCVWLLFWMLSLWPAAAQTPYGKAKSQEYAMKASWLALFIKYTEWPKDTQTEVFTIGILGEDPFQKLFSPVEGKPFGGGRLFIKRFGSYKPDLALTECQLLFISTSEAGNLEKIMEQLEGTRILTVSEIGGFAEGRGMLHFLPVKRGKIRYEVNPSNAQKSGLRITTTILKYAAKVITKKAGAGGNGIEGDPP